MEPGSSMAMQACGFHGHATRRELPWPLTPRVPLRQRVALTCANKPQRVMPVNVSLSVTPLPLFIIDL